MSHNDSHDNAVLFNAAGQVLAEEGSGISFTFAPLYDRLLVRVIPAKDRQWGGIILPAFAQEGTPHLRAEVIAAGHGRITPNGDTVPLVVKEGDLIAFYRVQQEQVIMPSAPGTEMMIIRELHVLGVYSDLPKATGVLDKSGREVLAPS
jgi:chaperonin GroES